jgi:hypothetical protein
MCCSATNDFVKNYYNWNASTKYIKILYLEYHKVCHLVGIRNPPPSPASKCVPPTEPKGKEHTRLLVSGWGGSNSDDWRKA